MPIAIPVQMYPTLRLSKDALQSAHSVSADGNNYLWSADFSNNRITSLADGSTQLFPSSIKPQIHSDTEFQFSTRKQTATTYYGQFGQIDPIVGTPQQFYSITSNNSHTSAYNAAIQRYALPAALSLVYDSGPTTWSGGALADIRQNWSGDTSALSNVGTQLGFDTYKDAGVGVTSALSFDIANGKYISANCYTNGYTGFTNALIFTSPPRSADGQVQNLGFVTPVSTQIFAMPQTILSGTSTLYPGFGYTIGGDNGGLLKTTRSGMVSGVNLVVACYTDPATGNAIPVGMAADLFNWMQAAVSTQANAGTYNLRGGAFTGNLSPIDFIVSKTLSGVYCATANWTASAAGGGAQVSSIMPGPYTEGPWVAIYAAGLGNIVSPAFSTGSAVYFRPIQPINTTMLNQTVYPNVTFPVQNPVKLWVGSNGSIYGSYLDSQGYYWIATAGYFAQVLQSLGNWSRFVYIGDGTNKSE